MSTGSSHLSKVQLQKYSLLTCRCFQSSNMRFCALYSLYLLLFVSAVFSVPSTSSDGLNLVSTKNDTSASANVTRTDYLPIISCQYRQGGHPVLSSCQDALSNIAQDDSPLTFGLRGTGAFDIPLPLRYLSGMPFHPSDSMCSPFLISWSNYCVISRTAN